MVGLPCWWFQCDNPINHWTFEILVFAKHVVWEICWSNRQCRTLTGGLVGESPQTDPNSDLGLMIVGQMWDVAFIFCLESDCQTFEVNLRLSIMGYQLVCVCTWHYDFWGLYSNVAMYVFMLVCMNVWMYFLFMHVDQLVHRYLMVHAL